MTRANGARLSAEIVHDGHHFLATVRWKPGHGGPQEVAGDSQETVEFRLRCLDATVKLYTDDDRRGKVPR